MSSETKTWRVGIVGVNPLGLFLCERLSLEPRFRLIGAFDHDPARRALATDFGCESWDRVDCAITSAETEVLIFSNHFTEQEISLSLLNEKHVIIDRPWLLSSGTLLRLDEVAKKSHRVATTVCLRRWSHDFVAASSAKKTGRLGTLHSANVSSCETIVPASALTPGVLREFGYQWLDELLLMVESKPSRIFAKQFLDESTRIDHGFFAIIEFSNGCTARIEVQSRSRLSRRTGWMLEGSKGSYRDNRIYEVTNDGEIVDEPLPNPVHSSDPFVDELVSALQHGSSAIPNLRDTADVVELMEVIERSAASGEVVCI